MENPSANPFESGLNYTNPVVPVINLTGCNDTCIKDAFEMSCDEEGQIDFDSLFYDNFICVLRDTYGIDVEEIWDGAA
jgi:hypothetical protein